MTVEELRASVIRHSAVINPREEVDALLNIVAAQEFERGRAEGAEQERERIRNSAIIMPLTPFGTITVPFSVLAPTKESEA